ncbi:hypothetical protein [Hymenobacter negativus]|uniref:DUF4177 domain-containing protein n=1 Tax=Hymenobacter negativus TaxID=2795026 RepID=A0ABS3QIQ3_9BACT|nr:hypothetical protein [Hymenobacter negativus]MBO2010908.1 hypothetical protein [Hymenobacter negativus]
MKHLFLFAALLGPALVTPARAQAPAARPAPVQYCSLLATQGLSIPTSKMELKLDYGKGEGLSETLAAQMKEQAATVGGFTAIVDALNYLGTQGWEYLGFNSVLIRGDYVHRYMLRRAIH